MADYRFHPDRCRATVKIHDDRWGTLVDQCELLGGHVGDHRHAMLACEPVAYIGWPNGCDCPCHGVILPHLIRCPKCDPEPEHSSRSVAPKEG